MESKNKKIFDLTRDEIYHLYIRLNLTQTDIAKMFKCDNSNVSRKLKKYNIKKSNINETQSRKQRKSNVEITKEMLINNYPKLSITEIGKKYGASNSYIYTLLKKFNISIMKNGYFQKKKCENKNDKIKNITKELLFEKYIINEKPAHKIGEEFGVDKNFIYRKLNEFAIKKRSKKESFNTIKHKELKKAILIKNIGSDLTNFKPNYNKESIKILKEFGLKHGLKLQHAENGGEFFIEKYSYWVDGYDEEKNIIVEYYENAHKYKNDYDKKRIENIKNLLNCKVYIIHENGLIEER